MLDRDICEESQIEGSMKSESCWLTYLQIVARKSELIPFTDQSWSSISLTFEPVGAPLPDRYRLGSLQASGESSLGA